MMSGVMLGWLAAGLPAVTGAANAISGIGFDDVVSAEEKVDIQDVTVSTSPIAAPEPGTLALLDFGLAGFALTRRRKA